MHFAYVLITSNLTIQDWLTYCFSLWKYWKEDVWPNVVRSSWLYAVIGRFIDLNVEVLCFYSQYIGFVNMVNSGKKKSPRWHFFYWIVSDRSGKNDMGADWDHTTCLVDFDTHCGLPLQGYWFHFKYYFYDLLSCMDILPTCKWPCLPRCNCSGLQNAQLFCFLYFSPTPAWKMLCVYVQPSEDVTWTRKTELMKQISTDCLNNQEPSKSM